MKLNLRKLFLPLIPVAIATLASSAHAQKMQVEGEKPEFDGILSPEFGGVEAKPFKPKEWLEIEAKLRLDMSPQPPSQTLDRMTVKWYVAVKNPDRGAKILLLTKDVEHANVPLGEDTYVSVYISPSSIKRLTGSDRAGKSAVELVGYEVLVNGVKVAEESSKNKAGWWNLSSTNISRTDSIPLLNKTQTPFAPMWWDRYAEVVVPNR